ncbi:MAG: S9 family peptidase [Gemmataceae bacterium]|nr:S9 family peptidase [Gemmataceae bacterium]
MLRNSIRALLVGLFLAGAADAQTKRPITVEDLWAVKRLGKPMISPDGKYVVVEVTTYSMETNDSTSDLWLFSTDGKLQRRLTTFQGKNSGPAWSPDSRTIAFVSKRAGDVAQIHLIAPDGGEARQLSKLPMPPSGLKWAPDGKSIFCIVNTWPDTPDDDSFQKREKARKEDKVQAFVIDDAMYRYWDHWLADGKRPVIFRVDVDTGKHANLFAGLQLFLPVTNASADSYDIAPDGKELCFTAESAKELGMDFNLDLYTMPLDHGPARRHPPVKNLTTDNPAGDFNPRYSPDGRHIAFLRQTIKHFYADRVRIMLHDRGTGGHRELSANLDRSVGTLLWFGTSPWLFFDVEDQGYHKLGMVHIERPDHLFLVNEGQSEQAADMSRLLVGLRSNFNYPTRLFLYAPDLSSAERYQLRATRLDRFNDDLVAAWDLGAVKNVTYKGADDEDVQMWIVYPPRFDPTKKWPLLMMVHGGPHNGITNEFHFRWNAHLLASKGYVVAIPNFHGSSGFGQKFTDSITGDMATKPFIDVMKATDYMEALPYIDKSRTAAAGASYGGFMMAWLNGHTDRFKAMICHAGVYNWHSMLASDVVVGRQRPLGAPPWGDLTKIDRQSPQRFAANFKTPTLILHGEKDYRVPVTQGFEYYNTLRTNGVPTRLVYFPHENHWITTPKNSRLWHREFFAWLAKYIGAGPTP